MFQSVLMRFKTASSLPSEVRRFISLYPKTGEKLKKGLSRFIEEDCLDSYEYLNEFAKFFGLRKYEVLAYRKYLIKWHGNSFRKFQSSAKRAMDGDYHSGLSKCLAIENAVNNIVLGRTALYRGVNREYAKKILKAGKGTTILLNPASSFTESKRIAQDFLVPGVDNAILSATIPSGKILVSWRTSLDVFSTEQEVVVGSPSGSSVITSDRPSKYRDIAIRGIKIASDESELGSGEVIDLRGDEDWLHQS